MDVQRLSQQGEAILGDLLRDKDFGTVRHDLGQQGLFIDGVNDKLDLPKLHVNGKSGVGKTEVE